MKNILRYLVGFPVAILTLASCDKRMEEMNTNPLALSGLPDEYLFASALRMTFGGGDIISPFHMRFASQYAHVYVTNSENRAADSYQDFHTQDIYKEMFSTVFTGPLRYINEVILMTSEGEKPDPVRNAMANIVAVISYAQAADCWGDIPYFEGAWGTKGILYPKYDPQKEVYTDMMARLKDAMAVLETAGSGEGYPGSDPVYNNDLDKWIRFANSLRLRMAMKIRFADPVLGAGITAECLAKPLIESNDQNFELKRQDSENGELYNPWWDLRKYQNFKMSEMFVNWLVSTGDPRLEVFVEPNKNGEYKGVLNGLNEQAFSQVDWSKLSNPMPVLYSKSLSQYLMCASEVWFLRAEAALFNLGPGDPDQFYRQGIRLNLELWGVDQQKIGKFLDDEAETTLSGDQENKFRQVETQAWIAFIPNFTEAWINIRRTGYPVIAQRTNAGVLSLGVTNGILPKRFKYASSEYLNNLQNLTDAINRQGPDKIDTPTWWDVREK